MASSGDIILWSVSPRIQTPPYFDKISYLIDQLSVPYASPSPTWQISVPLSLGSYNNFDDEIYRVYKISQQTKNQDNGR